LERNNLEELKPYLDEKGNLIKAKVRLTRPVTALDTQNGSQVTHFRQGSQGVISGASSADGEPVFQVTLKKRDREYFATLKPSYFRTVESDTETKTTQSQPSEEKEMQIESAEYRTVINQTELDILSGALFITLQVNPEILGSMLQIEDEENIDKFRQEVAGILQQFGKHSTISFGAQPQTKEEEGEDSSDSDEDEDEDDEPSLR
jgi:hypothetical protein